MKQFLQITEGFLASSKSQSQSISVLALAFPARNKHLPQARLELNFQILISNLQEPVKRDK